MSYCRWDDLDYRWWTFFFLFSFIPWKLHLTIFIVSLLTLILSFFIFDFCFWSFCRLFFQSHSSILICYILFFLIWFFFFPGLLLIFFIISSFTKKLFLFLYIKIDLHSFDYFLIFLFNLFCFSNPSLKNKIYFVFQF